MIISEKLANQLWNLGEKVFDIADQFKIFIASNLFLVPVVLRDVYIIYQGISSENFLAYIILIFYLYEVKARWRLTYLYRSVFKHLGNPWTIEGLCLLLFTQ